MRTVAIIQARMGSTRLPGKVLANIAGMTMLERVIQRTQQASLVDDVVVATTINRIDDPIMRTCIKLGVSCSRGMEDDVLNRYMGAAMLFDANVIVRITADCPFIDPDIIDKVILGRQSSKADYASNTITRTYPRGLDVEVFTYDALRIAFVKAMKTYERSHVTPYFYEHPELFNIHSSKYPIGNCSDHRWTVDTEEDLVFAREVYKQCDDLAPWYSILGFVSTTGLQRINGHVRQKELHEG